MNTKRNKSFTTKSFSLCDFSGGYNTTVGTSSSVAYYMPEQWKKKRKLNIIQLVLKVRRYK